MENDLQIRRLTSLDVPAYRSIRLEAIHLHPTHFGGSYERESAFTEGDWIRRVNNAYIFGAFRADELVGIAALNLEIGMKEAHKASLTQMYVMESFRNRGYAQRLLEAILSEAQQHVEQVHLTVMSKNEAGKKLYALHGFKVYGTEPRALKYDGNYYDEELMVKILKE
jgi:ribosomal protein S18 acetylase RimI-like enzyme